MTNKEADEWVSEICRCMTTKNLSYGDAVDYLMAEKRAKAADEPLPKEQNPWKGSVQIKSVSCPKCRKVMLEEDYPKHWADTHG